MYEIIDKKHGQTLEVHSQLPKNNTILHEYFSENNSDKFENLIGYSSQINSEISNNLVTLVFNDGIIPNEDNYSIISDYLGTHVEAYVEEG